MTRREKKDSVDSHGCEIGATDGKEKCVVIWLCLFVHSLVASPHYTFHSTTRRSFLIVIGARLRSLPILTRRRSEVKKNLCNALFSQSYVFFSSNFQVGCAAVERTVYSFFFRLLALISLDFGWKLLFSEVPIDVRRSSSARGFFCQLLTVYYTCSQMWREEKKVKVPLQVLESDTETRTRTRRAVFKVKHPNVLKSKWPRRKWLHSLEKITLTASTSTSRRRRRVFCARAITLSRLDEISISNDWWGKLTVQFMLATSLPLR